MASRRCWLLLPPCRLLLPLGWLLLLLGCRAEYEQSMP